MSKEEILELIGDFTWSFGNQFFIETPNGNFVWSDPDYGGNNILKSFNSNYEDWCKSLNIPYGRDKGRHKIRDYCGENIITDS